MSDNVNHPQHYTQGGIECIDALKAATIGKTGIEAVCVANVIKYLWRYEEKNGLEDIRKAQWYINHLIQELQNQRIEGECDTCYYSDNKTEDEPCCKCKNSAIEGSYEYNKRPLLYKRI